MNDASKIIPSANPEKSLRLCVDGLGYTVSELEYRDHRQTEFFLTDHDY